MSIAPIGELGDKDGIDLPRLCEIHYLFACGKIGGCPNAVSLNIPATS